MKTLNLIKKGASKMILAVLVLGSFNSFADGDRTSTCPSSTKYKELTALNNITNMNAVESNLMSPSSTGMSWMTEEIEEELEVKDLDMNYFLPSWSVIDVEIELDVEDYKATDELIPMWMIVEYEPELKVSDLEINL